MVGALSQTIGDVGGVKQVLTDPYGVVAELLCEAGQLEQLGGVVDALIVRNTESEAHVPAYHLH